MKVESWEFRVESLKAKESKNIITTEHTEYTEVKENPINLWNFEPFDYTWDPHGNKFPPDDFGTF